MGESGKKNINGRFKEEAAKPTQTEWCSPVIVVPSKNGELLFCIDYRKPLSVIVRLYYPSARMDDCIE